MAAKRTRKPGIQGTRQGGPNAKEFAERVREVGQRFSRGESELDIRQGMGITRRMFENYLRYLDKVGVDRKFLWAKTKATLDEHKKRAFLVYNQAMGDENTPDGKRRLGTAREALRLMLDIEEKTIALGQSLGIYDKAAEKHELWVDSPTMGMFHDELEDDELGKAETDPKTFH